MSFADDEKQILRKLAFASIAHGLEYNKPLAINISEYSKNLQENLACFVTLEIDKQLRGCIGSLQAYQPLVEDIVQNAYAAAFKDPRFPPLTKPEFEKISLHISILTKPEPIDFNSEEDLLTKIRPNLDGLILSDGLHRGTFLPVVWESLSDPKEFLAHLKMKAGFAADYWSNTIKIERYRAEVL